MWRLVCTGWVVGVVVVVVVVVAGLSCGQHAVPERRAPQAVPRRSSLYSR